MATAKSMTLTTSAIAVCPAAQLSWLKQVGCFTEVIRYTTRVFVPLDRVDALLVKLI